MQEWRKLANVELYRISLRLRGIQRWMWGYHLCKQKAFLEKNDMYHNDMNARSKQDENYSLMGYLSAKINSSLQANGSYRNLASRGNG